jgi:leucyl aminopeptidase
MKYISPIELSNQQAVVLILNDKHTFSKALPSFIQAEIAILKQNNELEITTIPSAGKYYILVKNQSTAEKNRVMGHKIRVAIPKTITSIYIDGCAEEAFDVAEGIVLSNYQFLYYRKEKEKERFALEQLEFSTKIAEDKLAELTAQQQAVYWSRDLVNQPVSALDAQKIAKEFEAKGKESGFRVEVLEKTKLETLKMGGLLAVNKGSIDPPTFTIMEYKPANPTNKKPIVLVGKGVVYDTGGLSLKPTAGSMDSMKCDMAGAACMAGTIYAASLMKLPIHIIALIPATDNRPGGNAYAPGDIITMFDGTTVEVLNTDAEGRMILADALSYSKKYDPELVIDAATLTGAAVRAIGDKASIMMGNADQHYFDKLKQAGDETFERVVQFPFWDDYLDEMKSPIADLKNIGGGNAGMITAGKFLEHFVEAPYIHLDIAGPAFLEKPMDYKGLGGTGVGVRLLINFLKKLA